MSRHDAQPDDSVEDLRDKLRRARFHERENYAHWQETGIQLATLFDEVRQVRNRCDDYATDDPRVRCGLDLAAGWLDVLLIRHEQAEDPKKVAHD